MSEDQGHIQTLGELDEAWRALSAGERFDQVRRAAPKLKERIASSGRAIAVRTFDLQDLPYPTRYAFSGLASSPVPYIVMRNRGNVVQIATRDGMKTLFFNPTDVERSAETPFFAELRGRAGKRLTDAVMERMRRPTPPEHLERIGMSPDDVDYVAFDHLHTQDLRRILGTAHVRGWFPRAKLLVARPEIEIFRALHPLQSWWYVRDGIEGIAPDRILAFDRDILLGEGVALVRTPGHTVGNWSLVLHTDSGMWAISENGVACDSYAPEASAIPGLKRLARREGIEVILNANTLEGRNEQYTSMILERALADRAAVPDFYQHLSSSELVSTPFTIGLSPTHFHGRLESGAVRSQTAAARVAGAEGSSAAGNRQPDAGDRSRTASSRSPVS
jgi:hypothetical protein